LNLILLQSIPTNYYKVPSGGLIETMMANTSAFTGLDITRKIESVRSTKAQWEQEAKCLAATIKVGAVDTMSIGCMASDIVLYVSLVVILGVIGIKFALAVIFGWFLSWKLGNFKEGESYASRMKRQAEIENWADNMQASAPLPRPKIMSTYYGNPKRKSLFPQTSRYTQPLHGSTRFDTDKGAVPVWRSPNK
jgi:chitin synthase